MPISPEFLEAVLPSVARKVLGPKRPIEAPALPMMRREGPVIQPQRPHPEQLADLHAIKHVFNQKHGEGSFEESLGIGSEPRYSGVNFRRSGGAKTVPRGQMTVSEAKSYLLKQGFKKDGEFASDGGGVRYYNSNTGEMAWVYHSPGYPDVIEIRTRPASGGPPFKRGR